MKIKALLYDYDIVKSITGLRGKVHSVYKNAITLEISGKMVTILSEERGKGPGFVLLKKNDFIKLNNLKPGDKVDLHKDFMLFPRHSLEIRVEDSKQFSSLFNPHYPHSSFLKSLKPGKFIPLTEKETGLNNSPGSNSLRDNLEFIIDYSKNKDNFEKSLLRYILKIPLSNKENCKTGSCVLPVFEKAVTNIFNSMEKSLENKDETKFAKNLKSLVGLGWGLTPGGDDFILGLLGLSFYITGYYSTLYPHEKNSTTYHFVKRNITSHLPGYLNRTNFISRSYLNYALEGRFVGSFTIFLKALFQENKEKLKESLDEITAFGACSGMDILAGVLFLLGYPEKSS